MTSLSARRIADLRHRAGLGLNHMMSCLSALARTRALEFESVLELERLLTAGRDHTPLLVAPDVAELYALALNCDVSDLESTSDDAPPRRAPVEPGQRFGHLTVTGEAEPHRSPNGTKRRMIAARCDCGTLAVIRLDRLRSGHATSCPGCALSPA